MVSPCLFTILPENKSFQFFLLMRLTVEISSKLIILFRKTQKSLSQYCAAMEWWWCGARQVLHSNKVCFAKKRWQMQNTNCLRNDVIIIKVVVRGKKDGVSFLESLQSIKNLKLTFHTRLNNSFERNSISFCSSIFAFFVQVICRFF